MCNISISIYPNENQPSLLSHALPSSAQRQQPYNHPESRNHPDPGASRDRSETAARREGLRQLRLEVVRGWLE